MKKDPYEGKQRLVIPEHFYVKTVELKPGIEAVDYSMEKRGWGYDYTTVGIDGERMSVCGWGLGLEDGDLVVFGTKTGNHLYRVSDVSYREDPRDMWSAEAVHVPEEEYEALEPSKDAPEEDLELPFTKLSWWSKVKSVFLLNKHFERLG